MSPRTRKQYEEIRGERRAQIMQTALELFATQGYENSSIAKIAKSLGISKGLLYNYFSSKEELLDRILNEEVDKMMDLFDPNHDGVLETSEMESFIRHMFARIKKNRNFYLLYFKVTLQPTAYALIEKRIEEMIRPLSVMTYRYFEMMGFENPAVESMLFGTMMDGIAFDYVLKPDLFPIDILADELVKRYCTPKTKD